MSSLTSLKLQLFLAWTCWTSPPVILQKFLGGVTEEYFNNFGGSHENCNVRLCVPQLKPCFSVIFTSKEVTWASVGVTPRLVSLRSPDDLAKASKSPLVQGSYLLYSWDKCPGSPGTCSSSHFSSLKFSLHTGVLPLLRVTLSFGWPWHLQETQTGHPSEANGESKTVFTSGSSSKLMLVFTNRSSWIGTWQYQLVLSQTMTSWGFLAPRTLFRTHLSHMILTQINLGKLAVWMKKERTNHNFCSLMTLKKRWINPLKYKEPKWSNPRRCRDVIYELVLSRLLQCIKLLYSL